MVGFAAQARRVFGALRQFIPRMCVLCGCYESRTGICTQCEGLLPRNDHHCCHCGQPLDAADSEADPCGACISRPPSFDIARAPMRYAFPVDVVLKKIKFGRQLVFAPPMAEFLCREVGRWFADCDVLVPVPLYRWRHVRRGFNQADELCKPLARQTGLPILMSPERRRATRSQSGLDAPDRARNVRNAFVVDVPLRYRYPLIVDDVITTGATCNALAQALKRAGAERVAAVAVARASDL